MKPRDPLWQKSRGFLERAIKAWGRDCPDTPEEPHRCTIGKKTCTIGKKFWFSDNGSCMITGVGGREKKRAEERLRACRVFGPEEEINGAVEAVSFDDTLGKLREVFGEGRSEDRTILICSKRMYEVIADFGRGLESDRMARVNTKYKTMDRFRVTDERGHVRPEFMRSGEHRTPIRRHTVMRAHSRWGWLPTTGGGGPVSENARWRKRMRQLDRMDAGNSWRLTSMTARRCCKD
jgi:hypothetical protein